MSAGARVDSPGRRALRKLMRRRAAVFGLCVVALFVLVAVLAPWIAPYDPVKTSWTAIRKAPSELHWFGTDENGRDILSRIVHGASASLRAGVISVSIAVALGVPIGLLAGYRGGWIDAIISRVTDAMLACPFLILAIAMASVAWTRTGGTMLGSTWRRAMRHRGLPTARAAST